MSGEASEASLIGEPSSNGPCPCFANSPLAPGQAPPCLHFDPFTSRNTLERAVQGIKDCQKILCSSPHAKRTLCLDHSLDLCIGLSTL
ncbi:hypothetical protein NYE80_33320 [Paenibacillus sp. FSL H7-0357]|uniref:hypothetical protein n=1 Tax=Paenibacillus sp. FSL H7-0357 TaxID=1536774 RepID=UPI0030CDD153